MANYKLALIRARQGDKFLTKQVGKDYWRSVDINRLDMGKCRMCIVGQSIGHYRDVVEMWGISPQKQIALGFFHDPNMEIWGNTLDQAWKQIINEKSGVSAGQGGLKTPYNIHTLMMFNVS